MKINFLNGYKTYIAGFSLLVWAIWAGLSGTIEGTKAIELVLLALSIIGLRSGIEK